MRKFLLGLALLAPFPASAQTLYRGQSGFDTGPIINCVALDGSGTARCLVPSVVLLDATGNPLGTAVNPIYTTGGGSGGGTPTGTAGSPNAAVVTVQGVTGGVPVRATRADDSAIASAAGQASYGGEIALTAGTTATAGRAVKANCTTTGNVSLTYPDGSTGTWIITATGTNVLPAIATQVNTAGTTATCTYANLK